MVSGRVLSYREPAHLHTRTSSRFQHTRTQIQDTLRVLEIMTSDSGVSNNTNNKMQPLLIGLSGIFELEESILTNLVIFSHFFGELMIMNDYYKLLNLHHNFEYANYIFKKRTSISESLCNAYLYEDNFSFRIINGSI